MLRNHWQPEKMPICDRKMQTSEKVSKVNSGGTRGVIKRLPVRRCLKPAFFLSRNGRLLWLQKSTDCIKVYRLWFITWGNEFLVSSWSQLLVLSLLNNMWCLICNFLDSGKEKRGKVLISGSYSYLPHMCHACFPNINMVKKLKASQQDYTNPWMTSW